MPEAVLVSAEVGDALVLMSMNGRNLPPEERAAAKQRHLVFLGHLALCAPFLAIWMLDPHQRTGISPESYTRAVFPAIVLSLIYLGIRAVLALRDPKWLRWEYFFPPLDVALVSFLIWAGDHSPIGHTSLLYLFPLVEAAGTLSVAWSIAVAGMVVLGAALASNGFVSTEPFPTIFRYYFFIVVGSLAAFLAKVSSAYREHLGVAQDRNRIALEMHDGVQAHLVTIATQMELASRLAEKDAGQTAILARESRESARLAADELRYLVQRLRAPSLEEGFVPALKQFAHNICARQRIELNFELVGAPAVISPDTENALFRVSQEAITNAIRHGDPTSLTLRIIFEPHSVGLDIADNGKGFDMTTARDHRHNGLESMANRIAEVKGSFEVRSEPGQGTELRARVPR